MNIYPEFVENSLFYKMHGEQDTEAQLAAMLNNMKSVFNLYHQNFDTFDELVKTYIQAGLRIFSLETGIVSHIQEDVYTVVDVVSNIDVINRGDVFPLQGTYCREVYESQEILGFPCVGKLLYMKNHPVYENLKLEAYLSAPIYFDHKLYGTLNFTSTEPRTHGFSQHEREMIALMASAIGNFLILRDREEKLQQVNHNLKKFVGFVSHDLRNPLASIYSQAKMGSKAGVSIDRKKIILDSIANVSGLAIEFVHSVLNLAALGTGKITIKRTQCMLKDIIGSSIKSLEDLRNKKVNNIVVDPKSDIYVDSDPSLLNQFFVNLFSNSLKYSPNESDILVSVIECDQWVTIEVSNSKSPVSIPVGDKRYNSVGFGLDIAKEIIHAHGSELLVGDDSEKFLVRFKLPLHKF